MMWIYGGVVLGVVIMEFWIIVRWGGEERPTVKWWVPGIFCLVCGLGVDKVAALDARYLKLCLCIVAGSFLVAAYTDYHTCQVYRFVWWIALAADMVLLVFYGRQTGLCDLQEPVVFCLLQELGFSKMYGRADCHAFCVGAITLYCVGGRMWDFLLLMSYAFGMLLVVQALDGNINRKGNLKRPVAFLPYITVALWVSVMNVWK